MRKLVVLALPAVLPLLPATAHADPWSDGCFTGPMDGYSRCSLGGAPAAGLAAVAAPFLVAGAIVTIADELNHSHQELPPGTTSQPNKKPSLSYVPAAPEDPYRN